MDRLTQEQRSALMASIKGRDTAPELFVRRVATKLGFRYRLHKRDLPGTPDLAFTRLQKAIFVNGCFWHAHKCQQGRRIPQSHREYWVRKRRRNAARDRSVIRKLVLLGWDVLVLWECELISESTVADRLATFLGRS